MELRLEMDYNQILGLVRQLPKKEKRKLTDVLQSEISYSESASSSETLRTLALKAPTWTEKDLETYYRVRKHINESRIS